MVYLRTQIHDKFGTSCDYCKINTDINMVSRLRIKKNKENATVFLYDLSVLFSTISQDTRMFEEKQCCQPYEVLTVNSLSICG